MLVWTWPNPPVEIISCLTSIFCFHISYRIKEPANDINNHLTMIIIWTLFFFVYPLAMETTQECTLPFLNFIV